jgi:hypothetical protein
MQVAMFEAQTVDPPELTGGLSLEKHADEINKKKLLNTAFLNAKLGPEGHPFEVAV